MGAASAGISALSKWNHVSEQYKNGKLSYALFPNYVIKTAAVRTFTLFYLVLYLCIS